MVTKGVEHVYAFPESRIAQDEPGSARRLVARLRPFPGQGGPPRRGAGGPGRAGWGLAGAWGREGEGTGLDRFLRGRKSTWGGQAANGTEMGTRHAGARQGPSGQGWAGPDMVTEAVLGDGAASVVS